MLIEIEGIVIKVNQYKEKDAMVSVLTKNGTVSFLARGIMSPTSKNASSCALFSHSNFTLSSKLDKLILTQGKLKSSYISLFDSLKNISSIQLIVEIIIKCLDEENGEIYDYLLSFLNNLNNGFNVDTLLMIMLAQIIKYSGYSLNYSSCVYCQTKKDLVSFSFTDGGFVCRKCITNLNLLSTKNILNTYLYTFKVKPEQLNKHEFELEVTKKVIDEYIKYLCECFGINEFNAYEIYVKS